jgi:glyoxylase-like metal-dependent hydrolase (beta-lactamase superfamily II)
MISTSSLKGLGDIMFEKISESIHVLVSRSFDSNIIFFDDDEDQVLVDTGTGMFIDRLEKSLKDVGSSLEEITDVVLTHSHIDHIGGLIGILENSTPKIHLHKNEADPINAGDMRFTLADTFGAELPDISIDGILNEGDVLRFGDIRLHVLHTPGHSSGSICLRVENAGVMITGDTMFSGGSFGRVDFPTGSPKLLVESLKRLSEMEFEIALPGHMSPIRNNAKQSAMLSYKMASGMFRM